MYEIFERLMKEKGVTPYRVFKETGVSQSSLSDWKRGRSVPKIDKLKKIAAYFGVSVNYLMGDPENEQEKSPALTEKDERDISKRLDQTLNDLENSQGALMFDGEPLDDVTKELLIASLRKDLEMGKRIAKQKFTPKKYRKPE
jgi:transcriptional regulator with XRE-family HTH domain